MRAFTRKHVFGAVVIGGVAALAGGARGVQPALSGATASNAAMQPCDLAAAAAIAEYPDDIDLIVVVEHASTLRGERVGEAAATFLKEFGADGLAKAWSDLATQLGWSETETFDRLLGERVVLVSRSIRGQDRRWALLSDVSVETEGRLKERLQAAPRAIDQGHQILSIENGEYELASHRRSGGGANNAKTPGPPGEKSAVSARAVLLLAPAGKDELFDQMIGVLSGAASQPGVGVIGSRDVFGVACGGGPAEVLVLAQLDAASDSPTGAAPAPSTPPDRNGATTGACERPTALREPWKDFVLLAGRHDPDGAEGRGGASGRAGLGEGKGDSPAWRSRVVVRQTARRDALMKIDATSDAPFRALTSGSKAGDEPLIAMIQNAPLPEVLGAWAPFQEMLSALPIPKEAAAQMSGGQAICVRAVPPDQRISCTVARQTMDTERLARTLDPAIAHRVQAIEKQFGVDAPPPQDYAGVAPNAVRITSLAASPESTLGLLSSRPLTLSWAYPSRVVHDATSNAGPLADQVLGSSPGAHESGRAAKPGWWAMNLAQGAAPAGSSNEDGARGLSPAELLRMDANALLNSPPQAPVARWVWLALARPAALEQLLPASVPDFNGLRSMLRRFERVNLELQITAQGDIQGDLTLRLSPSKEGGNGR